MCLHGSNASVSGELEIQEASSSAFSNVPNDSKFPLKVKFLSLILQSLPKENTIFQQILHL